MNKIKTAIKNLQDYLGRDVEGLRLLEPVARIANEIRTESAKLKESNDSKAATIQRLQAELAAANNRNAETVSSLARCESQNRQLRATEGRLSERIAEVEREQVFSEPDIELPTFVNSRRHTSLTKDIGGFTEMVNALRKDMRIAPAMSEIVGGYRFWLDDVISDYSGVSMMTVGRIATAMAMLNLGPAIRADVTFKDIYGGRWEGDKNGERILKPFIVWFRSNVKDQLGNSQQRTTVGGKAPGGINAVAGQPYL